jgi:hypothetical protein
MRREGWNTGGGLLPPLRGGNSFSFFPGCTRKAPPLFSLYLRLEQPRRACKSLFYAPTRCTASRGMQAVRLEQAGP